MKKSFFMFLVLLLPEWSIAQMQTVKFNDPQWQFVDAEYDITAYKGKESLKLSKGYALLKDLDFKDGTIQVDINFPKQRAFHHVLFRVKNPKNHEEFYIRPHQSGNPDANQYTPVINGMAGWQLYYGEKFAVPVKYNFDNWHTIKIVVLGEQAEVFIDDMENPILHINKLKTGITSGTLGLFSFLKPVHYANFQYSTEKPELKSKKVPAKALASGTITNWQISSSFSDKDLKGTAITNEFSKKLNWQKASIEEEGWVNLARFAEVTPDNNTLIASIKIDAQNEVVKKVDFGFSDEVKVYLNGQLLFEGKDNFRTRDYRFLGTMGFYDTVYLPLQKGENTLWFAVKEIFGGWGVQAKIEDLTEVDLVE